MAEGADIPKTKRTWPKTGPLSLVATVFILTSTYCLFQPSGTAAAWKCRFIGECRTMSDEDYKWWKCENTGTEEMRKGCRSNHAYQNFVKDMDKAHRERSGQAEQYQDCMASTSQDMQDRCAAIKPPSGEF